MADDSQPAWEALLSTAAQGQGGVEASIRYVKHNALQGREYQLRTLEGYLQLATYWRDQVANLRRHETTRERPCDRFLKSHRSLLLSHIQPCP